MLDPEFCAVLVDARSTIGSVSFGSTDLTGVIEVELDGEDIVVTSSPLARLSLPLTSLMSGNPLYDAELRQRLDVQRFPDVALDLRESQHVGGPDYRASGTVTLHGVTATLHGGVSITFPEPGVMAVTGEQVFDVRDFDIDLPTVLMLRIYPDVKVSLQLLARAVSRGLVGG